MTDEKMPLKKVKIIDTAEDLFQRFGIKRVSVEEICQKAGVSKMTFYKYFRNKNELVKFLWNYWFEQGMSKFEEIREMGIPFTERIVLILKEKEKGSEKISYELIQDYLQAVPEMKEFLDALYNRSIQVFLDFIKEAQQKGEVRPEMRPEFFLAVVAKLKELLSDEQLVRSYPTYKDFVLEVNNFMFYGILPRSQPGEA